MNNELDLPSNVEVIYQSLEEIHALLSMLEEQSRLGLFAIQSGIEVVEIVTPNEQPLILEDGSFLQD